MQGQRSSMGSLPDTISFDLNPTATEANIEPMFWNNNIQNYSHSTAQNLSGWNIGESSSSGTQNDQKIEDGPHNAISVSQVDLNQTIPYPPLFMQSASTQNINFGVEIGENSGNNSQVMEENVRDSRGYFREEIYSSDGSRLSCKRKALEGHIGQSSSSGSSNDWYNTHFGSSTSSTSLENHINASPQDQLNMAPILESSRRNHRVRINSSPQPSPLPTILPNLNVSSDPNLISYSQSSRLVPLNSFQVTRAPQSSRWIRGSRPNGEPESNISQINIPEIPIFSPTSEASRDLNQIPPHMSGNINVNGNLGRGVPHRTPPRYSRRLSEYFRRLSESGGQSSNLAQQPGSSSSGGGGNHGDHLLRLRSAFLLERQLGSASEIRNVLDLMRRGEGLRLEDMVILDQSVFFGMADIHDHHRDMRLDVDNMSYEELLALEERMGNVSTGLSEETIANCLKRRKFFSIAMGAQTEVEPCCICREEYNDGEDIGTAECGHEFHSGCIKQWLMLKNSCPICKTAALEK